MDVIMVARYAVAKDEYIPRLAVVLQEPELHLDRGAKAESSACATLEKS